MPYKNKADHNAACLRRYHANKEPRQLIARRYYVNDRKGRMLTAAKDRALKNGVPFEITVDDFEIPEYCSIFPWIKLEIAVKKASPASASLDRIVNEKGYVKGNIQIISNKANRMKSNGSLEELIALGDWARHVSNLR